MRTLLLAALLSAPLLPACECRKLTACEIAASPILFIGKVVSGGVASLRDHPWYTQQGPVRFEVIEIFRGLPPATKVVEIETQLLPGMCSPNPYRPGRTYLAMPSRRDGKFTDGICFTGLDIAQARDELEYVRHIRSAPAQPHFRGRVAAAAFQEPNLVDFLLSQGEAKPLPGATIRTTAGGKTFTATADKAGKWELAVPSPGSYTLEATLPPYPPATIQATLSHGCAVKNIPMISRSSIAGKVWNSRGQPLGNAHVGLMDLDAPQLDSPARVWFRDTRTEPNGDFLFDNVPIGRYLLAFNPDGPQSDRHQPSPLETTYYPNGASRAQAQIIEVAGPALRLTGKDLLSGPPVTFRPVSVKVRFTDGATMTTAAIRVLGEPIEPGGIPWLANGFLSKDRTEARFQAPANRPLRISVFDSYRRELPKSYESTHPPGVGPILQEFVIQVP